MFNIAQCSVVCVQIKESALFTTEKGDPFYKCWDIAFREMLSVLSSKQLNQQPHLAFQPRKKTISFGSQYLSI